MFVNWCNLFSECNPRLIQGLLTAVIRFIHPTRFSIISIPQRSQISRLELMASTGMSALFSSIQSWRFVSSLCASVKVMDDDWSRTWTTLNVDFAENGVPEMKIGQKFKCQHGIQQRLSFRTCVRCEVSWGWKFLHRCKDGVQLKHHRANSLFSRAPTSIGTSLNREHSR